MTRVSLIFNLELNTELRRFWSLLSFGSGRLLARAVITVIVNFFLTLMIIMWKLESVLRRVEYREYSVLRKERVTCTYDTTTKSVFFLLKQCAVFFLLVTFPYSRVCKGNVRNV